MTTSPEGITLLGSEMLTWSDLHGEVGAFGGTLAPHLLSGFGGDEGRVLVAGPATPELVIGLAQRFERADVLTRSWPDAQELRAKLPAEVAVLCGPLDRMAAPADGYDAVVAVAGTDRLHSAEEATPTWRAVTAHLVRMLGDRGELYLAVGNPVGVDRLVGLDPVGPHHDADWPQGHAHVPEPRDNAEMSGHLAELGLVEVETWVCHGHRNDPSAAAPRGMLTELRFDPVLLRAVEAAYAAALPAGGHLRDPGRVAVELVEAGLGAATAPTSVLHVRRPGEAPVGSAPALLVQERQPETDGLVGCRLERSGSGWVRTLLTEPAAYAVGPGLTRDPGLLDGLLPDGDLLAASVRDLLAQHDISEAGVLVRALRDWLGPDPASTVDLRRVPVLLERLVVDGDGLHLLDASYTANDGADRDTVLVRSLMRFALDLLARGARHPWSAASTPRSLATSLAAAGGVEVDQELFDRALELDRALASPEVSQADFEAPLGGVDAVAVMSHTELVDVSQALAARAAEQDAHVRWLLDAVQRRQRRLRKARAKMRALEESREYRLGRRLFWLRDLRRRRLARAREAQRGQWREKDDDKPQDAQVHVEEDLVPPGYVRQDGVTITPVGVDPGAERDD